MKAEYDHKGSATVYAERGMVQADCDACHASIVYSTSAIGSQHLAEQVRAHLEKCPGSPFADPR